MTERIPAVEFRTKINNIYSKYIRKTSGTRGIRRNEFDGNEVMKLHKRSKPNTIVAKIKYRIHILQEYVADDPESYHP